MRHALITFGLAALGLSGCVQATTVNPDFGVAVRQNIAAQVADPAPRYDRTAPPASDGPRTALAQQRYQRDQVIPPETTTTTTVGGGK